MNREGPVQFADHLASLACAGAALAARLGYGMLGVRFDSRPLDWFMQYIDPALLRDRLAESLWYLHSQPPGFNLFLGLVLKWSAGQEATTFNAVYALLAALLCWAVFALQRRLGAGRPVALVVTLVLATSPGLALYSNWLFHSLPVAVLLVLAALGAERFAEKGRASEALLCFAALGAVCLLHALFHLIFLLGAVAGVVWLSPGRRRAVLLGSALPVLVVAGVYAKNLAVFGRFTASTWTGMNLWATTGMYVPPPVRERLVQDGRMSEAALVDRFETVDAYPAAWQGQSPACVPVLTESRRTTGFPNFNHHAYIAIGEHYLRDAVAAVRFHPMGLVKGLAKAWFCYFKSPTDYVLLEPNRDRVAVLNCAYDMLLAGRLPFDFGRLGLVPLRSERGHFLGLLLLVGLPLVWMVGAARLRRGTGLPRSQRLVLVLILATIAWVALTGNTLEAGENQRFRFSTDPLSLVLLGLFIQRCLDRRARQRSARGRPVAQ